MQEEQKQGYSKRGTWKDEFEFLGVEYGVEGREERVFIKRRIVSNDRIRSV